MISKPQRGGRLASIDPAQAIRSDRRAAGRQSSVPLVVSFGQRRVPHHRATGPSFPRMRELREPSNVMLNREWTRIHANNAKQICSRFRRSRTRGSTNSQRPFILLKYSPGRKERKASPSFCPLLSFLSANALVPHHRASGPSFPRLREPSNMTLRPRMDANSRE